MAAPRAGVVAGLRSAPGVRSRRAACAGWLGDFAHGGRPGWGAWRSRRWRAAALCRAPLCTSDASAWRCSRSTPTSGR